MDTRTLLHVGPFQISEDFTNMLRSACQGTEVVVTHDATPAEQLSDTQFDVLVTEEIPHNLADWPRLRFIQLVSAGINHLQGHAVWQTDIVVANASGTHTVPIAQYVTCAMLMLAHRMPQILVPDTVRQWKRDGLECSLLREQTVGILGYGSIGRECARQLQSLGMRVVCMKRDPTKRPDEGYTAWPGTGDSDGQIPERWFGPSQLHEMLPLCDTLVIATPATPATLGMIGKGELAQMKPTANLVNIARGGIVEEAALADALRTGQLAGAAVDCFVTEPIPPDHRFFDTPNLILTPHMSGVCDFFWPVMAKLLNENLHRYLDGKPILNRVNPTLGY